MKSYKLIKEYPNSPSVGLEVVYDDDLQRYAGAIEGYRYTFAESTVENFPEFWEKQMRLQSKAFKHLNVNHVKYFEKLAQEVKHYLWALEKDILNDEDKTVLKLIIEDLDNLEELAKQR